MYEKLINFIKTSINDIKKQEEIVQSTYSFYKPVVLKLKPKGKTFKKENAIVLLNDPMLFNRIDDALKNSNVVLLEELLKNKIMYNNYLTEMEELASSAGFPKDFLYNDKFLLYLKRKSELNSKVKIAYEKILEMKQREEKLHKINEEITVFVCNLMIDLYENADEQRIELRNKNKHLISTLNKIISNKSLEPNEVFILNDIINSTIMDYDAKTKIFEELNSYIKNTSEKKEVIKPTEKQSENKKVISTYTDYDILASKQEKENDELVYNYIDSIKKFENENDIICFLESIKYNCNIVEILNKIITYLENCDDIENEKLKEILVNYLSDELKETEIPSDEVNEKGNTVLYYGFLDKTNKILDDIKKSDIPKEYYEDILNGINMIKHGELKGKSTRIKSIKKVLKLRIKDIRITYKRLTNNVYVILGVFCKKDNKGYDIIQTTGKRNNELLKIQNSIILAQNLDFKEIFNKMLEENSIMEDEIISVLNSYTK